MRRRRNGHEIYPRCEIGPALKVLSLFGPWRRREMIGLCPLAQLMLLKSWRITFRYRIENAECDQFYATRHTSPRARLSGGDYNYAHAWRSPLARDLDRMRFNRR